MINLDSYVELDTSNMDRETAVLIYNNKVYFDTNHQFALETALNEIGKTIGINLDENIDQASDVTYNMSKENEIATLDIWTDVNDTAYLVSHFEEQLTIHWDLISRIALEQKLIIGSFDDTNPSQKYFKVFIEQPA